MSVPDKLYGYGFGDVLYAIDIETGEAAQYIREAVARVKPVTCMYGEPAGRCQWPTCECDKAA